MPAVLLREPWRRSRRNSSQSDRSEIWIGWILLCWLKSDITMYICAIRSGWKKEKAQWKQSKYITFSVGSFSFSHSFFHAWVVVDDGVVNYLQHWGQGGGGQGGCFCSTWDSSAEAFPRKKGQIIAPFHLWPLSRLDPTVDVSRTVSVQLWTADGSEHSGGLWCTWAHRCIKYWSRSL